MELLLLETFDWNLCMPTPAHFIDYYLHASVQESDLYNGWPLSSLSKTKVFMEKYTHYFLEVSLQGGLRGGGPKGSGGVRWIKSLLKLSSPFFSFSFSFF